MTLHEIITGIKRSTWYASRSAFAARPYLDALDSLETLGDSFGADSGKHLALYALSNMATFKGDEAKTLKAALKALVKAAS